MDTERIDELEREHAEGQKDAKCIYCKSYELEYKHECGEEWYICLRCGREQ
jgi:hypothetical protein